MTITYPRQLPSLRIQKCDFEPQRNDLMTPDAGGQLTSTQLAEPLWHMKLSTDCDNDADFGRWRAWNSSLKGALRLFYGQDVFRRFPRRYAKGFAGLARADSSAFDGTATNWAANTDRDEITLQDLPISFRMSEGDYIGLRWSTSKRALLRVLEDASADGDGAGTWSVEPGVPAWVPDDAVVNLAAPDCLMKIVPGTWASPRDGKSGRSIAFEALQHNAT